MRDRLIHGRFFDLAAPDGAGSSVVAWAAAPGTGLTPRATVSILRPVMRTRACAVAVIAGRRLSAGSPAIAIISRRGPRPVR